MTYEHILFEEGAGVATLRLNRPKSLNALHRDLVQEMLHALHRLPSQARALLITGQGRAFCSGADLSAGASADKSNSAQQIDAGGFLETHLNPLLEKLFALPIPVVVAVNGAAAGAGCSLALAGDIVIAAQSAYFLQAFVNIGLVPDVGSTWMLPRLVGRARAQAMMMLGERVAADQALDWGMVYQVVEDSSLMTTASQVALRLARGPTVAYGLIRQGLRECLEKTLTESLAIERRNQHTAGLTRDFSEGVAAFNAKRPPVFQGR